MNCPNCGLEKEVTTRDLIFALMSDLGARTNIDFRRCSCRPDIKPPVYWKGNDITKEEAEAIINEPVYVAPVVLQKTTPKVSGISIKKEWKFRIVDANKIPRQYLIPDEKAIGATVRGCGDKANIPGVEIYSVDNVAAGRRAAA